MASVRLIHYTHKVYKDGTSPVILQIISRKKTKKKVLCSIKDTQWDDKQKRVKVRSHPNYLKYNATISEEFNKYEGLIIEHGDDIDLDTIFKEPEEEVQPVIIDERLTYWALTDMYLEGIKIKSGYTYATVYTITEKFKRFVNKDDFYSEDFTDILMDSYLNYLRSIGNSDNTINNNIKKLRFSSTWGHKNKIWKKPTALHELDLPSMGRSRKVKLTDDELKKFRDFELPKGSRVRAAQCSFILSYYLRGMRVSDILQLKREDVKGDKLYYKDQKTGGLLAINIIQKAKDIIDEVSKHDGPYILPFLKWVPDENADIKENNIKKKDALKNATSHINGLLKKIAKEAGVKTKISNHIARHTYARKALKTIKDPNITMSLLGHTSMEIHQIYATEILSDDELDTHADKVFEDED